jgi:hypothetical protein
MTKPILIRAAICIAVGLLLAFFMNEIAFRFLSSSSDRAPQEIELIVPAGTADQIARGENPPSIPENVVFVVGDVLTVKNEDAVDHQLGPMWIPSGKSASLSLDKAQLYSYSCSFQTTQYLGLDVRDPVTLGTRIGGIIFAGLPMGFLIALYSLIAYPIKKAEGV